MGFLARSYYRRRHSGRLKNPIFQSKKRHAGFAGHRHEMLVLDLLNCCEGPFWNDCEQPPRGLVTHAEVFIIEQYRQRLTRFGTAAAKLLLDALHLLIIAVHRPCIAVEQILRFIESELTEARHKLFIGEQLQIGPLHLSTPNFLMMSKPKRYCSSKLLPRK